MSGPHLAFPDNAVPWRVDLCVAQVDLRYLEARFFGMKIRDELLLLRLEYRFSAAFRLNCNLVASQRGLCLLQVGLTACELGRETFFIGDSRLNALLRRRLSCEKSFLPRTFSACPCYVRLSRADSRFGCGNLCFRKINPSRCFLDLRVLQLALSAIVLDGRIGRFNCCRRLSDLSPIVVVFEFNQEISGSNSLIVGYFYRANDSRNFRAQRREVASHVGIICSLFNPFTLPRIPVSRKSNHKRCGKKNDSDGCDEAKPGPSSTLPGNRMLTVFR